eukprot:scaffold412_cov311-Pavlova_lutheri.AAC.26
MLFIRLETKSDDTIDTVTHCKPRELFHNTHHRPTGRISTSDPTVPDGGETTRGSVAGNRSGEGGEGL